MGWISVSGGGRYCQPWQGAASPGCLKLCFGRYNIGGTDFGRCYWIVDDQGRVRRAERRSLGEPSTRRLQRRGRQALARLMLEKEKPLPSVEAIVDYKRRAELLEKQLGV